MDLVENCKDKLSHFRIKELKDVLNQIGLSKQGKKQELMDRILAFLLNEEEIAPKSNGRSGKNVMRKEAVETIIEEIYRKMQGPETSDSTSKGQTGTAKLKKEKTEKDSVDSSLIETKIRCLCGSLLFTDTMIKCDDPECNVWQHIGCVIISENPIEAVPTSFYCELCRLKRADPFWVTLGHALLPIKLDPSVLSADGNCMVQFLEKSFTLSRSNRDLLQRTDHDLQVWCMLLNDKVPFRMHWPLNADLQVNSIPIRIMNRPNTQQLGNNGRDDGPLITTCSREGINKICYSKGDVRTFCFGIRIAKRRTVQQVLDLVPREEDGEPYSAALSRVRRCIGGGPTAEGGGSGGDSDSDVELVSDSVTVNLRCPMSGSRMRIAGRFKPCAHMGCFDLETLVELNQRSRKWQCPICLNNYSLESIIIDPYFNCITNLMRDCGEETNEIEVKPDGSWRIKNNKTGVETGNWHLPDGTLCSAGLHSPTTKNKTIKNEPGPHLNSNTNPVLDEIGEFDRKKNIVPMDLDFTVKENYTDGPGPHAPMDLIVLSDSDEDNVAVISPTDSVHGGPGPYSGLLNDDTLWDYQSCPPQVFDRVNPPDGGNDGGHNRGPVVFRNDAMENGDGGNWISLTLGGARMDHNPVDRLSPLRAESIDAASILHSLNGDSTNKNNSKLNGSAEKSQNQKSYGPFSPPRQPRSVRQRLIVSIDSDSD